MLRKRVVFAADPHCGHRAGLTPTQYQSAIQGAQYHEIQKETWRRLGDIKKALGTIDIAIWNGDLIDGKGSMSGGTELITADTNKQIEMAIECVEFLGAKKNLFTYGTPYHGGKLDDYEVHVAGAFGGVIKSHLFVDINGVNFDVKHEPASKSKLPHTKAGALGRDWLANMDWTVDGEQPEADVFIRSHVHRFDYAGNEHWLGMTTPALQGAGSKYGARRCSGRVTWGLVHFDVGNKEYTWNAHVVTVAAQKQKSIRL